MANQTNSSIVEFVVPGMLPSSITTMGVELVEPTAVSDVNITHLSPFRLEADVTVSPMYPPAERVVRVIVRAGAATLPRPQPLLLPPATLAADATVAQFDFYVGALECCSDTWAPPTCRAPCVEAREDLPIVAEGYHEVKVRTYYNTSTGGSGSVVASEWVEFATLLAPEELPPPNVAATIIASNASDVYNTFLVTAEDHVYSDDATYRMECALTADLATTPLSSGSTVWYSCGDTVVVDLGWLDAGSYSFGARQAVGVGTSTLMSPFAEVSWSIADAPASHQDTSIAWFGLHEGWVGRHVDVWLRACVRFAPHTAVCCCPPNSYASEQRLYVAPHLANATELVFDVPGSLPTGVTALHVTPVFPTVKVNVTVLVSTLTELQARVDLHPVHPGSSRTMVLIVNGGGSAAPVLVRVQKPAAVVEDQYPVHATFDFSVGTLHCCCDSCRPGGPACWSPCAAPLEPVFFGPVGGIGYDALEVRVVFDATLTGDATTEYGSSYSTTQVLLMNTSIPFEPPTIVPVSLAEHASDPTSVLNVSVPVGTPYTIHSEHTLRCSLSTSPAWFNCGELLDVGYLDEGTYELVAARVIGVGASSLVSGVTRYSWVVGPPEPAAADTGIVAIVLQEGCVLYCMPLHSQRFACHHAHLCVFATATRTHTNCMCTHPTSTPTISRFMCRARFLWV